ERIPAAAGIVNLRYKSCPEMAGQDQIARIRSPLNLLVSSSCPNAPQIQSSTMRGNSPKEPYPRKKMRTAVLSTPFATAPLVLAILFSF
ncbi:hypothetical protein QP499_14525, partial [Enterobacter hormaechei]|uniref:hypothetical protein n=1 Tax=Enterobacter hormaechei TaxID=158836 RepID=UPI00254A3D18